MLFTIIVADADIPHLVMRDEIETTMKLLGATSISELGPHLLNTKAVDMLLPDLPVKSRL